MRRKSRGWEVFTQQKSVNSWVCLGAPRSEKDIAIHSRVLNEGTNAFGASNTYMGKYYLYQNIPFYTPNSTTTHFLFKRTEGKFSIYNIYFL